MPKGIYKRSPEAVRKMLKNIDYGRMMRKILGEKNGYAKHSDETKKRLSEMAKERVGPKNGHWKGGVSLDRRSYMRKWNKDNPEVARASAKARRARKRGALGGHTQGEWELLVRQYGGKCPACHQEKPLTRDHIVPLCRGGSDFIENIQPLCLSCNSRKHSRTIRF